MKAKKAKQKEHPPAKQSALEQRAQREDWSQADRARRASQAHALCILRKHYKATMPGTAWQMIRLIKIDMLQATTDCLALDAQLTEKGLEPVYMDAFALFHDKRAIDALHFRAWEHLKEIWANASTQYRSPSKLVLYRIKERMRDGNSCADALWQESGGIHQMATNGDTDFFVALAYLIREAERKPEKYSKRPLSGWIVRAWLPLCLWECPANGRLAHERITEAAYLLNTEPPDFPSFLKAWRNVRNRAMKTAVQYAQKAMAD